MVARGDLAVEAGAEVVPIVQRRIIALCRKYGRLSIVATQMMASMVSAPEPTRAEVSDVSSAVVQGADVVMLSDETANGNYPIETITAMKKVILYTQDREPVAELNDKSLDIANKSRDAISVAAISLARQINAAALIVETKTGATAANVAAHRPNLPIISVTSELRSAQQLALCYTNRSYVRSEEKEAGLSIAQELKNEGYFGENPVDVIVVSGLESGASGKTDTIRLYTV